MNKNSKIYLQVNTSQIKNPVFDTIKLLKSVNDTQIADFVYSDLKLGILFISLSFYYKYPLYLKEKFEKFKSSEEFKKYQNKILLCLFDTNDINNYLNEITNLSLEYGIKILIGFSFLDIGNYLKSFINISNNPYLLKK